MGRSTPAGLMRKISMQGQPLYGIGAGLVRLARVLSWTFGSIARIPRVGRPLIGSKFADNDLHSHGRDRVCATARPWAIRNGRRFQVEPGKESRW
jgi:hypothetical protein